MAVGYSPEVLFVIKTDSHVTLAQLWNESVTPRPRPISNQRRISFFFAEDTRWWLWCLATSMELSSSLVGTGQMSGLSRQIRTWLDQTTILTANGMRAGSGIIRMGTWSITLSVQASWLSSHILIQKTIDMSILLCQVGLHRRHGNPAQDRALWTEHHQSRHTGSATNASQAMPSPRWRPQLHAGRGHSSIAGDTPEGNAAGPMLRSIQLMRSHNWTKIRWGRFKSARTKP